MSLYPAIVWFDLHQLLGDDFDPRRTKAYVTTNVENGTLIDTSTGEIRMGDQAVTINADGTGEFTTWSPSSGDGNPLTWQTTLVVDYPRTGHRDRTRRTFGPYTITETFRDVTNKALTSNVATLTVSEPHGLRVGDTVDVYNVDATFNGPQIITAVPTTTSFSYAKTAANVASTASTGTIASAYVSLALLEDEQAIPPNYQTAFTASMETIRDEAIAAGLNWRGAWSAATAYAVADAVSYGGSSYRRLIAGTTATNPAADPTRWGLLASKGDQGPPGPGTGAGAWQASTAYVANQVVQAPDGSMISRNANGTSRATFDATEQAAWTVVLNKTGTMEQAALTTTFVPAFVANAATYGDGVTDATTHIQGLVNQAKALAAFATGKREVFLPAGTYLISSTILLGNWVSLTGAGTYRTLIKAPAIASGPAIQVPEETLTTTAQGSYATLSDFRVQGTLSATVGVTTEGGILIQQHMTLLQRVDAIGFNSGGWNTLGVVGTDERYGFKDDYTVGVRYDSCNAQLNDINFYATNEGASVVSSPCTTTTYENCTTRMARVHAIKWHNSLTQFWNNGTIESNAGLVTVMISAETGAVGPSGKIKDAHWEGNHRLVASGAAGSRAIMFDNLGTTEGVLEVDGAIGDVKPEYSIELVKATGSRIGASLNGTVGAAKVGSTCVDTRFTGRMNNPVSDAGTGTVIDGQIKAVGTSTALAAGTPSVSNVRRATGPAGTITNLTNGTDGQIVTIVGGNTTLSGSAFILPNGGTSMQLAIGSILTLRRSPSSVLGTGLALAAAGDTVTATAHGLPWGRVVRLSSIVSATGVAAATDYYVVNPTTNTFQLATTLGGSAVDITADGTATVTVQAAWKCIGHEPSAGMARMPTGASSFFIDDRETWYLDDTNVTAINTINGGYEGQRITIHGKHTGSNSTTVVNATGNLRLSGTANLALAANDTLTLAYDQAANRWREVGRSVYAAKVLEGAALLDFPSIPANSTAELTITVTGAATGNVCISNAPAALAAGLMHSARVTAADTVTVRLANVTTAAIDPANQSWTVRVLK